MSYPEHELSEGEKQARREQWIEIKQRWPDLADAITQITKAFGKLPEPPAIRRWPDVKP